MPYDDRFLPSCSLSLYNSVDRTYHPLPATSMNAAITVRDVHAQVILSQSFSNKPAILPEHTVGSLEAIYTFPLAPASAVCAFEAVWDDGTKTRGVVMEKLEAKEEYDKAVDAGKQAGLMEQHRDDIFTMRVENIPAEGQTTIRLTYIIELSDDGDLDHVRFTLPTTIAPKYSSKPSYDHVHLMNASINPGAEFDFVADIEMANKIEIVSSPSHQITVAPQSVRQMKVSLGGRRSLDKDLVLVIKSRGLDVPRAFVEAWEAPAKKAPEVFEDDDEQKSIKSKAIALTLVPRFSLTPLPAQEYIFLLDRSGSMNGNKIASLRKAMQLILRSLPTGSVSKTYIQIVSFGSTSSEFYRNGSVIYDEEALRTAAEHCKSLQANFGGTEMAAALDTAIKSRRSDVPTSLFVLTDGETWNLEQCLGLIRVAKDGPNPLRVFSLGIGDSADHLLVESLARVGDGISLFVGENERLESKVMRLLRAAQTSGVRVKDISWGNAGAAKDGISLKPSPASPDDFEILDMADELSGSGVKAQPKSKSLFDAEHQEAPMPNNDVKSLKKDKKPVFLPPLPGILMAPTTIPRLYPGIRFTVYALITGEQADALAVQGQSIKITAVADGDEPMELEVPIIETVQPLTSAHDTPLLHTLAARELGKTWSDSADGLKIKSDSPQDFSTQDSSTPSTARDDALDILKAQTVRLCLRYSLASAHTSFITIKETKEGEVLEKPRRFVAWDSTATLVQPQAYGAPPPPSGSNPFLLRASMPGYSLPPMPSAPAPASAAFRGRLCGGASTFGLSRMSRAAAQPPAWQASAPSTDRSAAFGAAPTGSEPPQVNFGAAPPAPPPPQQMGSKPAPATIQDKLDALVEEQSFEGSWDSLGKVVWILGFEPFKDAAEHAIGATILALVFFESKGGGAGGVYSAILHKGWDWVYRVVGNKEEIKRLKSNAELKFVEFGNGRPW